ncbi:MAG: 4'-phosphopantetheinyl transferase superfamily protein [Ruminococcus sp.]|jgi:phosphopantetheine--protein transferase-like protein|nr:4'-phosphopantetheinyl transferase superfamily protein [Ruminococcus sp.]
MFVGIHTIDFKKFCKIAVKPHFRSRILTSQEMKFLMQKDFSTRILAEMYVLKGAFIKAMGGAGPGCKCSEISILSDYSGTPYISLTGKTKKLFDQKRCKMSLSSSTNRITATGIVIFMPIQ